MSSIGGLWALLVVTINMFFNLANKNIHFFNLYSIFLGDHYNDPNITYILHLFYSSLDYIKVHVSDAYEYF
jgi:hypothetical protein